MYFSVTGEMTVLNDPTNFKDIYGVRSFIIRLETFFSFFWIAYANDTVKVICIWKLHTPDIVLFLFFFSFLLDTTTKNFQYQMLWLLIITNNPAYIVNVQLVLD